MKLVRSVVIFLALLAGAGAAFGQANEERDKGIELYRSGQFAEAIVVLEKLVDEGQADQPAGLYLAAAYVQTGETKKADGLLGKLSSLNRPTGQLGYATKIKYIKKTVPRFGEAARRTLSAGTIRVLVEFKRDGTIGFVFPFAATSDKLISGAIEAAKDVEFEPAIMNGAPVNVVNVLEYRFTRY
jgi:hypothetical protein